MGNKIDIGLCGNQHVNTIESLYRALYSKFEYAKEKFPIWIENEKVDELDEEIKSRLVTEGKYSHLELDFKELSHFTAMKGEKYDDAEKRIMIVGRATNGWQTLDTENAYAFAASAAKEYEAKHFDWVIEKDGVLCDLPGTYKLTTPFWSYTEAIVRNIYTKVIETKWIDYIAWSNIYKVSPPYGNNPNPDSGMKKIQQDSCIRLLKKEMDELKPTHIIFVTGWDWISEKSPARKTFIDLFSDVEHKDDQINICRGANKNSIYVEGTGAYNGAKVVFACRPENRNKDEYVKQVCEAFERMEKE